MAKLKHVQLVKVVADNGAEQKKDAAIVVKRNKVVGKGYNTKDKGVSFHASLNAIVDASQNLEGCTLYVRYYPCNECAKLILVSGITEVIYIENQFEDVCWEEDLIRKLFEDKVIQAKMGFSIRQWTEAVEAEDESDSDSESDDDDDMDSGIREAEEKKSINHKKFMDQAMEAGIYTDFLTGERKPYAGACIVCKDYETMISAERVQHPCEGLGLKPKGENRLYACHAELRAIIAAYKKRSNLNDCVIYCTHYPSIDCGALIIKSGIKRVLYKNDFTPKFDFQPFKNVQVDKYDTIIATSGVASEGSEGISKNMAT